MEYGYTPSTSSYAPYPVKVLASFLHFSDDDGNSRLVPMYENKGSGDWGDHAPIEEDGTLYPMPGYVWLRWWSIPEQRCYGTDLYLRPSRLAELWKEHETGREPERYKYFVFGLSPYGGVAVWMKAQRKSVLLKWTYAEADDALQGHERALLERLQMLKEPVALPPKAYFDQNMQQYTYRYVALEDYWDGRAWQPYDDDSDEMFCDRMEELLFDGTRDQLGSEYLFGYHRGGVPRCLSAIWYHGRNEYRLCFWLDREAVMQVFQQVYRSQPEARADFIVRFDLNAKKPELALRREDMAQPVSIPEESYEVLVLRNNNLCWKSPNFSKAWDAWRW